MKAHVESNVRRLCRAAPLPILAAAIADAMLLAGCMSRFELDLSGPIDVQLAALDEQHEVALTMELNGDGKEHFFLVVRPRPSKVQRHRLTWGRPTVMPSFENIEVRADSARDRIWMIDPSTQVIVATLDRKTGEAMLVPNPPPTWATLDGGEVLAILPRE